MVHYGRLVRAILLNDAEATAKEIGPNTLAGYEDDTGRSPLHIAVLHARDRVVEPLVNAGASVNTISGDGETPLDIAVRKDQPALYRHLINAQKRQCAGMALARAAIKSSQRSSGALMGDMVAT